MRELLQFNEQEGHPQTLQAKKSIAAIYLAGSNL
jgi:hypothetical protein